MPAAPCVWHASSRVTWPFRAARNMWRIAEHERQLLNLGAISYSPSLSRIYTAKANRGMGEEQYVVGHHH
jgi:hypothetical protein